MRTAGRQSSCRGGRSHTTRHQSWIVFQAMRLAKWFTFAVLMATTLAAASYASEAQRFSDTIFYSYEPLVLRVEGPLDDLFAHAQQDDYSVRGALTYRDRGRDVRVPDVKISVRGHTSRNESECTFPKLK